MESDDLVKAMDERAAIFVDALMPVFSKLVQDTPHMGVAIAAAALSAGYLAGVASALAERVEIEGGTEELHKNGYQRGRRHPLFVREEDVARRQ